MPPQIIPKQNTGLLPQQNESTPAPIVAPTPQSPTSPVTSTSIPSGSVDHDALNFTHALALKESGVNGKPNYNAIGDNGTSAGAYQWNNGKKKLAPGEIPINFKEDAKKAGLNPDDFSPENQDKVEYATVVAKKKQGWTPAMIAAAHNAGDSKAIDGSWEHNVGTVNINGKDIHYDTPSYVAGVKQFYDQLSQNQTPTTALSNAQATTPAEKDTSLGGELKGRVVDAGNALTNIIQGKKSGQTRLSGLIQGAGAIAGAVNDVATKGLELIPGVKALEGFIGKGAAKLAQTPTGQSVLNSIQSFSEKHPELSKDIGAGINIVTAIPILDGLGAVKNIALDGAAHALKSTAEKAVTKDLTSTVADSVAGKTALKATPDAVDTLVKERAIPEISKGRYVTKNAYDTLTNSINATQNAAEKLKLINAQDLLQHIEGQPVKFGIVGNTIKYGATAAGEYLGEHVAKVPLVGGYLGNKFGSIAEDAVGNTSKNIIERSAKNSTGSVKGLLKKSAKATSAGLIHHSQN